MQVIAGHLADGAETQIALGDHEQVADLDLADEGIERGDRVAGRIRLAGGLLVLASDVVAALHTAVVGSGAEADQGQPLLDAILIDALLGASLAQRDLPDAAAFQVDVLAGRLHHAAAGGIAQLLEDAILHAVFDLLRGLMGAGADAFHEVFVAEALVEGDELDLPGGNKGVELLLHLRTAAAEAGFEDGQRLVDAGVGLAGARRAVEDLVQRRAGHGGRGCR